MGRGRGRGRGRVGAAAGVGCRSALARLHDDELADAARTSQLGCALVPRGLRESTSAGDARGVRAVDLVLRPLRIGPVALLAVVVGRQAITWRPPAEAAVAPVALGAGEHDARPQRQVPVHREAGWDERRRRCGRRRQAGGAGGRAELNGGCSERVGERRG